MPPDEFRRDGHALVEWIARYFEQIERYPVLSPAQPGELTHSLPAAAPEHPEPFEAVIADLDRLILPHATHWNHPGFFGYFAITGSAPGVLMDFVSAALNQQAMLWRTSPAATELEAVTLRWLARLMRLPDAFDGVIYDTASISTLHALAAAREQTVPDVRARGLAGRTDIRGIRVYASEHAHSSVDKAVIALGLGHDSLRRIGADDRFALRVDDLVSAVRADRAAGVLPMAVVATVGTTSSTGVDEVPAIAALCASEGIWLHVDAAYAGVMAMVPGFEWVGAGFDRADSIVVNPHKWLFTPFDLSVLFTRRMDVLRQTFSLVPEYLKTAEAPAVNNLMDTGVQLGRRFRSLKLWAILRYFGADGLRARLAEHVALAREFAGWVDRDPDFERVAPAPFSVVCFRATRLGARDEAASINDRQAALDALNARILDRVNRTGEVFLSHTKLEGRYVLRLAIGNLRTEERHVARAWALLREALDRETAPA
jgi:aromatic-L-amino-acid decarboxylase